MCTSLNASLMVIACKRWWNSASYSFRRKKKEEEKEMIILWSFLPCHLQINNRKIISTLPQISSILFLLVSIPSWQMSNVKVFYCPKRIEIRITILKLKHTFLIFSFIRRNTCPVNPSLDTSILFAINVHKSLRRYLINMKGWSSEKSVI